MKTTDRTSLAAAEVIKNAALAALDKAEACLLAGDPEDEAFELIELARNLVDQRDELLEEGEKEL